MLEQDPTDTYTRECVEEGIYTYNTTWLCDPPSWKVKENKNKNLILEFISGLKNFISSFL